MKVTDAAALVAGAAAGYGADAATTRLAPRLRGAGAAAGLVTAAAIYPLARRRLAVDAALTREVAGVAATGAVAVAARRLPATPARRILGIAWAAHAAFDAVHTRSPDSRLPAWYPAMCAGYDIALGARLVTVG